MQKTLIKYISRLNNSFTYCGLDASFGHLLSLIICSNVKQNKCNSLNQIVGFQFVAVHVRCFFTLFAEMLHIDTANNSICIQMFIPCLIHSNVKFERSCSGTANTNYSKLFWFSNHIPFTKRNIMCISSRKFLFQIQLRQILF